MTHKSSHVIISKVREFVAAWPLSAVSGGTAIGAFIGWLV